MQLYCDRMQNNPMVFYSALRRLHPASRFYRLILHPHSNIIGLWQRADLRHYGALHQVKQTLLNYIQSLYLWFGFSWHTFRWRTSSILFQGLFCEEDFSLRLVHWSPDPNVEGPTRPYTVITIKIQDEGTEQEKVRFILRSMLSHLSMPQFAGLQFHKKNFFSHCNTTPSLLYP